MDASSFSPTETVVVLGQGARFHRPNAAFYDTECGISGQYPARKLSMAEARREGYAPCERPGCFDDAR